MLEFVTGISKGYPALAANFAGEREHCFKREVAARAKDAWIDGSKKDERDEGADVVGYEIPFNWYFCRYELPLYLEEIDADLDVMSHGIVEMLREVYS